MYNSGAFVCHDLLGYFFKKFKHDTYLIEIASHKIHSNSKKITKYIFKLSTVQGFLKKLQKVKKKKNPEKDYLKTYSKLYQGEAQHIRIALFHSQ